MEDLERYSDYNEYEEDEPKSKSPVGLILKILVGIVCIAVVGILVFRMILFNYYPESMKNAYFNSTLDAAYKASGGSLKAMTQELRAPYDDPDKGRFFCDNLIVIEEIDQLQVSVRFNVSLMEVLSEEVKLALKLDVAPEFSADSTDLFTFRLVRNPVDEDSEPTVIGRLDYVDYDSLLMYRYCKLVFDGVDFGLDSGEDEVNWIRLEILLNGYDEMPPYMVAVYENNSIYSEFDDFELK